MIPLKTAEFNKKCFISISLNVVVEALFLNCCSDVLSYCTSEVYYLMITYYERTSFCHCHIDSNGTKRKFMSSIVLPF